MVPRLGTLKHRNENDTEDSDFLRLGCDMYIQHSECLDAISKVSESHNGATGVRQGLVRILTRIDITRRS
jgi:hypothetical protein